MSAPFNPEIASLWRTAEQLDKEIAEIRARLNRLNKIVRANICQAVWQSIALFIGLGMTVAGGLAYQTSVLNNRFEQIEKRWEESDKRFAASSESAEKNLTTLIEESETNEAHPVDNLKQQVRPRRK
ncbi:MAG: hypothetical protein WAU45_11445 [Blastocatellia bacterium]